LRKTANDLHIGRGVVEFEGFEDRSRVARIEVVRVEVEMRPRRAVARKCFFGRFET
jgi:hypothetical protein